MSTVSGRRYTVTLGEKSYTVSVTQSTPGEMVATLDGACVELSVAPLGPHAYSLLLGDESVEVGVAPAEGGWTATLGGLALDVEIADEAFARFTKAAAAKAGSGKDIVRAPMPGLVVGVKVEPGERVEPGAPVIVLEAMKMQNELASKHGGIVEAIKVKVGDKVDKGQVLAILTA